MVLLSEGSSVKESPEDNKPLPLVPGEAHLLGGPIFSVKSGPVPGFSVGSEYSVTLSKKTGQAIPNKGGDPQ